MPHTDPGPTPEQVGALVADYLAAWNEPDAAVRSGLLARCWDPAGVYLDPTVRTQGPAALGEHIGRVQASRPGSYLELVGDVDQHHDVVHFRWRQLRPGRPPGPVSRDFGQVGPSGRLVSITGFFGSD
ncbi:nuclear transport factor 2 family protein [Nocardioides pantholopis]|uniref:nuclear transport factor 2 family protein n=1 Tax=Nocardioides pantholopis TaxID=2483798 RepID=UPI000F099186|nr:nuclear transport factor 2 family protein [Nocardioides pantholopis]